MGPREKHLFKMWRFECTYILREKTQQRGVGREAWKKG